MSHLSTPGCNSNTTCFKRNTTKRPRRGHTRSINDQRHTHRKNLPDHKDWQNNSGSTNQVPRLCNHILSGYRHSKGATNYQTLPLHNPMGKYKNSRPIQQCYNCQAFGHSSTFCGKTPKCVKCELTHATRDCTKPIGTPPKCTNCEGPHPANFTGCPRYLLQLQHQQQNPQRPQPPSQIPKQTPTSFKYRQNHSPDIKTSAHPPSPNRHGPKLHPATPNLK